MLVSDQFCNDDDSRYMTDGQTKHNFYIISISLQSINVNKSQYN